ncbi:MAG: Holliday junction ATP-dependent DNA helicase RuvA [Parcubacteria group bacterium GW2011_GWF2_42_7]|nr:MAG: Holliday junction ATP-dependent DNA helicase RuvA [Parcubacteria group bacterium GW2011_GWF2_42_7]
MIAFLEGKVVFKGGRFLVLDVGGVGYRVFAAPAVFKKITQPEQKIKLWIHLHVREDALEMYGFTEYPELDFFENLIKVSGIGPKTALNVLAVAPVDVLKKAIAAGQTSYLTKVSGIGAKSAQKIIIELKEKLGGDKGSSQGNLLREEQDAIEGLVALGYSTREARDALKEVPAEVTGTSARIKQALKKLGK